MPMQRMTRGQARRGAMLRWKAQARPAAIGPVVAGIAGAMLHMKPRHDRRRRGLRSQRPVHNRSRSSDVTAAAAS
jgi:hypothetical protein